VLTAAFLTVEVDSVEEHPDECVGVVELGDEIAYDPGDRHGIIVLEVFTQSRKQFPARDAIGCQKRSEDREFEAITCYTQEEDYYICQLLFAEDRPPL
jgi:hypothetical protein